MRILIITWFYPPWNETASRRPYSWAAYFAAQGHKVNVVTPIKDARIHPNLNAPAEPCANINLVETPLRFTRIPIGKGASWAVGTIPKVIRLARESDLIISTFMPWYIHVLGRIAKQANPTANWLADYRDLWHEYDFFTNGRPIKRAFLRSFEKCVVSRANLITTVSPPLAAKLQATHPHVPCKTIYNGFPAKTLRTPWERDRLIERRHQNKPFRILYAGTLYPGYHDPEPVFRAISSRTWPRQIKLIFLGHAAKTPLINHLRQKYNLEAVVETPEYYLDHQGCLELQHDVDLLLHLGWTNTNMDGVLSAKVFEYMASGTPILSVGAGPDTSIGQLLSETKTGVCTGTSDHAVRIVLEAMSVDAAFCSWYNPCEDVMLTYSRETQAEHLEQMITALPTES